MCLFITFKNLLMKSNMLFWLIVASLCISCSNFTNSPDKTFLGGWKYLKTDPNDKPDDGSMGTEILTIKKFENSQKSYVIDFLGKEMVCSVMNDNTLGLNGKELIRFDPKTGQLSVLLETTRIVFTKLE